MSVPVENSKNLEKTFIYLLTLFNLDYNTLAAYALIKIDYTPLPPPSLSLSLSLSHKKHNKNVKKKCKGRE